MEGDFVGSELSSDYDEDGSPETVELSIGNEFNMANLQIEGKESDVCLVVGGKEYPTHREILSASSEVFKVMLMCPQWSESQERRIVLKETPACEAMFGFFLGYLYTSYLCIQEKNVLTILELADKYMIQRLCKKCSEYMVESIPDAVIGNHLISWLEYALVSGHSEVANACKNFVKWNFEMVAEMTNFEDMEPEMMNFFLQQNDLVVYDEMSLYKCVVKWLNVQRAMIVAEYGKDSADEDSDSMEEGVVHRLHVLITTVMSNIRYPMMSPNQLVELSSYPLVKSNKEFFDEMIAMAASFHADNLERVEEAVRSHPLGGLLFTPRSYTSDQWGVLFALDHLSSLPSYKPITLVFHCSASCAMQASTSSSHTTQLQPYPSTSKDPQASSLSPASGLLSCDYCKWVISLYPKGLWYQQGETVVWDKRKELAKAILETVRVSVTCPHPVPIRGQISVLVYAKHSNMRGRMLEYVCRVICKTHEFGPGERVLNIDDLIPYQEINPSWFYVADGEPDMPPMMVNQIPLLIGDDTFKVRVVISALRESRYPSMKRPLSP